MVTKVDPVLNTKSIMDRFSLKGKTSLVTGAGQGIGRALAHGLADAGAAVAVIDLDLNLAEIVAHEITTRNPDVKVMALKADVTNPDQVTNMVDEIVKNWGSLTIACNNAGIGQWVDTLDMSYEDWQRMIRIDLDSVFLCAQEARKNARASIIPADQVARKGMWITPCSPGAPAFGLPRGKEELAPAESTLDVAVAEEEGTDSVSVSPPSEGVFQAPKKVHRPKSTTLTNFFGSGSQKPVLGKQVEVEKALGVGKTSAQQKQIIERAARREAAEVKKKMQKASTTL